MVKTRNKQVNKCTYATLGDGKCYEDLKQESIVQEVCDADLMLIEFPVRPLQQGRVLVLILAKGP